VVSDFAKHFGKSADKLGPNELRTYQAYPLTEKLTPAPVIHWVAALRFFFVKTQKRHQFRDFLPYPPTPAPRCQNPNTRSNKESMQSDR